MFAIPTRTRYGMRALIQIALSSTEHPVSLLEISEKQKVSKKYLESIFKLLKMAGIVNSVRGPEGGYLLAKKTTDLTAFDIMDAIDGPILTVQCLKNEEACDMMAKCITRNLWGELQDTINSFLTGKTLDQVIQEYSGENWVI